MLSQETRPFVVDGPVTISARDGATGSQFCIRHHARSIDDLRKIGAIPRFIDLDAVKRAVDKVTHPAFATTGAQRRLQEEVDQRRAGALAVKQPAEALDEARLEQLTVDAQVDGVIEALDRRIARPVRRKVAMRALDLVRAGSYAVTSFELDRDLEVRATLTFDAAIGMCKARDVRVEAGAFIESRAPHFILHARSLRGTLRSAATGSDPGGDPGIDGREGTGGGTGATGRHAVCRGVFSSDLTPTNGGKGGDAGEGTDGLDGIDGSAGGDLEQHLEVLVSGMVVNASGGPGGKGGRGGKGGPGGAGGKGGNGNGCEPSGLGAGGGAGGKGGDGGNGGNGGEAGDIFVYYVSDQSAGRPPVLTANGGAAGAAGGAGLGGEPGAVGEPGDVSEKKFGTARWDPPPAGAPGAVGATGENGAPGTPGRNKTPVLEAVPLV